RGPKTRPESEAAGKGVSRHTEWNPWASGVPEPTLQEAAPPARQSLLTPTGPDMAEERPERLVLLNRLAEEFAERCRRGERPSLEEYADRPPELADDIRLLFPVVAGGAAVGDDPDPPSTTALHPESAAGYAQFAASGPPTAGERTT